MISMRGILAGVLSSVILLSPIKAQTNLNSAKVILSEMLNTYRSTSTYQDVGILRLTPQDSLASRSVESLFPRNRRARNDLSFKILFSRPQMFRFEWQTLSDRTTLRTSVIWFDGSEGHSWSVHPAFPDGRFTFERKDSIESLIEFSRKQTGDMVLTVPSLLMSNLGDDTFAKLITDLTDLSVLRKKSRWRNGLFD